MTTAYDLSKIRTLLIDGFSEAELRDFCFDTPEFRPVHHELADLTGKAVLVRHLLEFAERRALLDPLLAWAKEQNPAKYAEHQPYLVDVGASRRLAPTSDAPAPRPLRVFLCHASADKPIVRDLYQRLSQEGFVQPWLDEEELLPGQDWDTEIRKAVRASDVVLVCLSPQSITKAGYVQKEIKFALDIADEQPEGTIFLIPLRLEACEVPERLSRWQWANLFEARGYDRLLRALHLRAETVGVVSVKPYVTPSAEEESPPSPVISGPSRPTAVPTTYTVQSGDTLDRIAQKVYGNARQYPLIQQANNLVDPSNIWVGQVLVIPPLSSTTAPAVPNPTPTSPPPPPPPQPVVTVPVTSPVTPPPVVTPQPTQPSAAPPQPPIEWVGSPNFNQRRSPNDITAIVILSTANNRLQGIIDWYNNPNAQVSTHYTIGKDGKIVQHVRDCDRAWYAGQSVWKGRNSCNDYAIGIGLINLNDGQDPYPEAQHQANVALCAYLCYIQNIKIDDIIGHSVIALPSGRKSSPRGYDLNRLRREVAVALGES